MLEELKKLNPNINFFDIYSEEFSEYGKIVDKLRPDELISLAQNIKMPESGSMYIPSVAEFETTEIAKDIKDAIFGTLDTQVGYCYGYSSMLNATEWHSSSELNVAITPLVLILGQRRDIKDGRLDSSKMKAFFVPRGSVIEVYATTLHFCPCQVSDAGFGCVVALVRGTNTPLDEPMADRLLFRRNKWIIAHEENSSLIERGVVAGIYGENYKINY